MKRRQNRFITDYDEQMSGLEVIVFVLLIIALLATLASLPRLLTTPSPDCSLCHSAALQQQNKMTEYFRKKGNPTPEVMAEAVLKTRNPRLLAAVAVKGEKNTPHWVRKGGYKRRHAGAWQVSEKDWGPVPYDVGDQAKQAERALEELVRGHGITRGLNRYGGDKTKQVYAANVLKELQEVPR